MGRNHDFPARTFCLAIRKKILEEPLCAKFQKPSGTEEITDKKGEYRDFPLSFFCVTVRRSFRGESFCVLQKFWYRKKVYTDESGEKEGMSRFPVENFSSHGAGIFRR